MKTKLTLKLLAAFVLIIFFKNTLAQPSFEEPTNNAVFSYGNSGTWDDKQVWNPAVIKDGDTLKMWYTGGEEIVWEGAFTKIGYAWSIDGISWYPVLISPENVK